jgi:hypothetical protein
MQMLAPTVKLPDFEVLAAGIVLTEQPHPNLPTRYRVDAYAYVYVVPRTAARVVLPHHRTHNRVQYGEREIPLNEVMFSRVAVTESLTIKTSSTELVVDGPGSFIVRSSRMFDALPNFSGDAKLIISMTSAGAELAAVLTAILPQAGSGKYIAQWGSEPF